MKCVAMSLHNSYIVAITPNMTVLGTGVLSRLFKSDDVMNMSCSDGIND